MNIEEIDKWLKDEEGISYTELGNEFNDAVELSNKCAKKIMQKDKEIKKLNNILDTLMQDMALLNATGIKEVNVKHVFDRIVMLRGEDDED